MIYGVDGQFGSGKSSYVVYIASQNPGIMIYTNIKMNTVRMKNVYEFSDNELLSIFRTNNLINDMERAVFDIPIKNSNLMYHPREKFTRSIIALDESGALKNAREWVKNFEEYTVEYVNQNRKNFLDVYLCSADGGQNDKSLRQFVEWWYYSKPFINFPIFEHVKVIRKQKREKDGVKVIMDQYTGMDMEGDIVMKQKPMDYYHTFYWQPGIWQLYDDLHKNIRDPHKYSGVRLDFVKQALTHNRYLGRAISKKNEFAFLLESPELFVYNEKGKLRLVRDEKRKKKKEKVVLEIEWGTIIPNL